MQFNTTEPASYIIAMTTGFHAIKDKPLCFKFHEKAAEFIQQTCIPTPEYIFLLQVSLRNKKLTKLSM